MSTVERSKRLFMGVFSLAGDINGGG
jgi:hypothetical protein